MPFRIQPVSPNCFQSVLNDVNPQCISTNTPYISSLTSLQNKMSCLDQLKKFFLFFIEKFQKLFNNFIYGKLAVKDVIEQATLNLSGLNKFTNAHQSQFKVAVIFKVDDQVIGIHQAFVDKASLMSTFRYEAANKMKDSLLHYQNQDPKLKGNNFTLSAMAVEHHSSGNGLHYMGYHFGQAPEKTWCGDGNCVDPKSANDILDIISYRCGEKNASSSQQLRNFFNI